MIATTDELARTQWPHAFVSTRTGEPIAVHGVNLRRSVRSWGRTIRVPELQRIADSGFDSVRLVLDWPIFEPAPGEWNETAFAALGRVLDDARTVGLPVILDPVHLKAPGHGGANRMEIPAWVWQHGDPVSNDREAEEQLIDRLRAHVMPYLHEITSRVAGDPNVIAIDLVNEPRAWPPLAATVEASAQSRALDLYEEMIATVRALDPDQIVMVEPVYGSSDPAQFDITRLRPEHRVGLVYSMHDYFAGGDDDGYGPSGTSNRGHHTWDGLSGYPIDRYDRDTLRAQMETSIRRHLDHLEPWRIPLHVGEWGIGRVAPFAPELIADKLEIYDTVIDDLSPAPADDVALPRMFWTWTFDGRFGLVDDATGPESPLLAHVRPR